MPIARPPRLTGSDHAYQHLPFGTFPDDAVALGREKPELRGIAPHLHMPQVGDAEARDLRRRNVIGRMRTTELSVSSVCGLLPASPSRAA